jgi:hypothetical protein
MVEEPLQLEAARGTPAGVQPMQPPRPGIPGDGEQVAPDAAAGRLHEAERRVGRDRRIDGAAALLEDVQRDLRRQGLAGRRHAMRRQHLGAGDEFGAGDAICAQ